MGGRGASSGLSDQGKFYGSQYHTLYQSGNIKFVTKVDRNSEALMETMTKGRVYATVNGGEVRAITFFDIRNRRAKVIAKDSDDGEWHAHYGYFHNEYSLKDDYENLTASDRKILDDVRNIWNNRK